MAKRASGGDGAQFVRYFGPLLDALRDLGGSSTPQEAVERIASNLAIPDQVLNETLPSGELRFRNQVHWARFYLMREEFLQASKRGIWALSELGKNTRLDQEDSRQIFLKWVKIDQEKRRTKATKNSEDIEGSLNETELVEELSESNALEALISLTPGGFERFCQRLLRESGFSEVNVTGRSGDGGIDGHGTLEINPLVSFKVLFQCKKYQGAVGSPEIRNFRGAMLGRADKGIVITTGTFTVDARREAVRDGAPPIELIDGQKIVQLMERLELGLVPRTIYEVDSKFFDQFD